MSALIKSGAAAPVSILWPALSRSPPAPDPGEIERAEMASEIERLRDALADARATAESEAAQIHARGVAEGKAQADRGDTERLELLAGAMAAANAAVTVRLEALDALAPLLVRAALDKIFGACTQWDSAVAAMVARQLAVLRRSNVVAIHVSPSDFPDCAAVEALAAGDLRVARDAGLRAGACRIECKLGAVDLDARDQLVALAGLLEDMAR